MNIPMIFLLQTKIYRHKNFFQHNIFLQEFNQSTEGFFVFYKNSLSVGQQYHEIGTSQSLGERNGVSETKGM